jgi:hypothetical protein
MSDQTRHDEEPRRTHILDEADSVEELSEGDPPVDAALTRPQINHYGEPVEELVKLTMKTTASHWSICSRFVRRFAGRPKARASIFRVQD